MTMKTQQLKTYVMTCPMEPPRLRTPGISDCGFGWVSKKFQKQPSSLEYSCSKNITALEMI